MSHPLDHHTYLPKAATPDKLVIRPAHYTKFKIEPITFIMANGFEFWRGNIVKYASRAGSKPYEGVDLVQAEIIDLEKAQRNIQFRLNQLKGLDIL